MISISAPVLGPAEAAAVRRVIMSGQLAQGPEVAATEAELALRLKVPDVVLVANGTVALELALRSLELEPGAEVITSPFTFFASVSSIIRAGAVPVLADIDARTYNLDPDAVEAAITPRTAVLMPVHLYGRPCDMDSLCEVAQRHGLAIVEDACQAIGAAYGSAAVGSFGLGCFSFYGSKNLTAGEGGAIACRSSHLARRLRTLRNQGSPRTYTHTKVTGNFRMTDLQAAILRVQLSKLETLTKRRQDNAEFYDQVVKNPLVTLPPPNDHVYRSCYHQYTIRIRSRRRSAIQRELRGSGVESRIYYPRPVHLQPAWPFMAGSFPVAERAAQEVLSIPVHPQMSRDELATVAGLLNGGDATSGGMTVQQKALR